MRYLPKASVICRIYRELDFMEISNLKEEEEEHKYSRLSFLNYRATTTFEMFLQYWYDKQGRLAEKNLPPLEL